MKFLIASPLLLVSASAADVDFYRDVFPALKANCIACHNKTTAKGDLNMETPELIRKGGDSGPGLVPGKSAESLVVQASLHQNDMEMPPKNNKSGAVDLTPEELDRLKAWIDQGAKSSTQQERQVTWQPLAPGVHPIYSVATTQDGRYAACGRGNEIFIYDLATRQLVTRITDPALKQGAHRDLVQSLAFSPDGTRLASSGFREVKIWKRTAAPEAAAATTPPPVNPEVLKAIATTTKTPVLSHAASPDGKQIVTASADGVVRIWDAAGKPQGELRGRLQLRQKIAELERTVDAQNLELAFHQAAVARIEAQNKALAELLKKANDAIASMRKALPEKQKAVTPAAEAAAAAQKAVEAVKEKIAAAASDALTKELKDAEGKLITAKMTEADARAAVAATESNITDAQADAQRIADTQAQNATKLTEAQNAIAKAKKTQEQATAEIAAAKKAETQADSKAIAVAFSSDAQRVAALLENGTLRIWAVASGQPIEESPASSPATLIAGTDGSFTVKRSLNLGAAPRWTLERHLGGDANKGLFVDRVNAVRFSPDGKLLATGGGEISRSGDVHLFDVASGKMLHAWKDRHEDAVLCVEFTPDGKRLASGGADKLARVTDLASGKQVQLFEGHTHYVLSLSYRADGRTLATAGADNVVLIWDTLSGERQKKIEGWSKEVTSLQYIGSSNQILTSAGDNRVRIIKDDGTQVRLFDGLPDFMQAVASVPGMYVAGGEDSRLHVWNAADGKPLVVFEAK